MRIYKKWLVVILSILIVIVMLYTNRYRIYAWLYRANYDSSMSYKSDRIREFKIHGIDVSHHQGLIDWSAVKYPDSTRTIDFVFMRASVGMDKDKRYQQNWKQAGKNDFLRGAYHYYWSNVNSAKQAQVFINQVVLKKGDLPPVLDIEDTSTIQNSASLRKGLKNWIKIVETHYGVKPIIYTGEAFYRDYLKIDTYFKDYPRLWIANYNRVDEPRGDWDFWQFTDRMPVSGIITPVDGNVYRYPMDSLNMLKVK